MEDRLEPGQSLLKDWSIRILRQNRLIQHLLVEQFKTLTVFSDNGLALTDRSVIFICYVLNQWFKLRLIIGNCF